MTLADLHRAVETALKRLGTPVFVRYLAQSPIKGDAVIARLAQISATIRAWLGQPLERIYGLGNSKNGQVLLTLECRGGATALVSWATGTPRGDGVDLTILGNHGALYHDAGGADLWDEAATAALGDPDKTLVAAIEQALASGKPIALGKGGTP
jgi:hypothetical protein